MAKWTPRSNIAPAPPAAPVAPTRSTKAPYAAPSAQAGSAYADPYLVWALETGWRAFRRAAGSDGSAQPRGRDDRPDATPSSLHVIARAPDQARLQQLLKATPDWLKIAPVYRAPLEPGQAYPLHFTAQLAVDDLPRLQTNEWGLQWELSLPRRQPSGIAQATTMGRFGPQREELPMLPVPLSVLALPDPVRPKRQKLPAAIAIIDFGCPFLHRALRHPDGGTRVARLWDQRPGRTIGDSELRSWSAAHRMGHGRVLRSAALDSLTRTFFSAQEGLDEAAYYRTLDYLIDHDDPRRRVWFATHGAHVLDVAAGNPDPVAAVCGGEETDAAAAADVLFVQLPDLAAADSSGGSLSALLLDGVRWAIDQCTRKAPLVVNISYGCYAGAHDGSSLLESALDELLSLRRDDFAIVLGAGNARGASCHARRTVCRDQSALLRLDVTPDDTTDTFVEVWYPQPGPQAAALALRVRTAGRDWSPWVEAGQQVTLADDATGETLAMLQVRHGLTQYQDWDRPADLRPAPAPKAMALLSLVPTGRSVDDDGALNDPGLWEIEVRLADDAAPDASVSFDAWVERDDPGGSIIGRAHQPRFIGPDLDDERNTLSSIATGRHTIAVGGYRWRGRRMAEYSSLPAGPCSGSLEQRDKLFVLAPCEQSLDEPHIRAAAVRSDDHYNMNGTSVAAPVVARRLFNQLKQGTTITRTDWARVLDALANAPAERIRRPEDA